MPASITITDKEILHFYEENPHLNIISMNHIFINILKQLSTNLSESIDNATTQQILSVVTTMNGNLNQFQNDFFKSKSDVMTQIYDMKKEYIEDLKLLLSNSELSQQDKTSRMLERNGDALIVKTNQMLNEIIPKHQEKTYSQIEGTIRTFLDSVTTEVQKLLTISNVTNQSDLIVENVEKKFNVMVSTIQQPIFAVLQSSEERTCKQLSQVKDTLISQKQIQETLSTEMNSFLNKYKTNSSVKGAVSESELYRILQVVMPLDEVFRVSTEAATCDFKVVRHNKKNPTILFENKDYTASVNSDEVKKFERDLKTQKHHGIFISQNSPIAFKNLFHIDIIHNQIHVYIPNANYDPEKIKIAIQIIDSLSEKLMMIQNTTADGLVLSVEELEQIREEYRQFANKKIELLEIIKSMTKQMTDKLEDIQLPSFKRFELETTESKNLGLTCNICEKFIGKNKASISAHQKKCFLALETAKQQTLSVTTTAAATISTSAKKN